MAKKFDATLKTLLEESPADWPHLAGFGVQDVDVVDADVSTVTGATDKVLRVRSRQPWIMHLDFQAGPDVSVPRRVHGYNGLLGDRHELPVHSVVILLRSEANLSTITGLYTERLSETQEPYLVFRYQVIRVWQLAVEPLLEGGLSTLPLAPISAVTRDDLPRVVHRMKDRLRESHARAQAERLWTAAYVLMGLRYDRAFTEQLLEEVLGMEESVTYQAIVAKGRQQGIEIGRVEEARDILLRQGKKRFKKAAPARLRKQVEAIADRRELESLLERLLDAGNWDELLPPPGG